MGYLICIRKLHQLHLWRSVLFSKDLGLLTLIFLKMTLLHGLQFAVANRLSYFSIAGRIPAYASCVFNVDMWNPRGVFEGKGNIGFKCVNLSYYSLASFPWF